jgi:hypothetical protein
MEWADLRLWALQVGRADLHRGCTKSKSRQYATRIRDPPSGDNWHLHSVDQRHSADLCGNILRKKHSPMPAGFDTLGDNCVASLILKPPRLIDRSSRRQDLRAGPANPQKKILVEDRLKSLSAGNNLDWDNFRSQLSEIARSNGRSSNRA